MATLLRLNSFYEEEKRRERPMKNWQKKEKKRDNREKEIDRETTYL